MLAKLLWIACMFMPTRMIQYSASNETRVIAGLNFFDTGRGDKIQKVRRWTGNFLGIGKLFHGR